MVDVWSKNGGSEKNYLLMDKAKSSGEWGTQQESKK